MNDRLGSVEQTLSGRWRVRMSLAGVGRKTIDTFDTREEADAQCAVMAEILKREQPYTGKTVLGLAVYVILAATIASRGRALRHASTPEEVADFVVACWRP